MAQITKNQIKDRPTLEWLEAWTEYLQNSWGLNIGLAEKIALLFLYAYYYNVSYTINSGFRDPAKQQALLDRWNAGDRVGIKVKPAKLSKHSFTTWLNNPDSNAIDISFSNPDLIGSWSGFFGLKWGGKFRTPDKVHYFI